MTKRPKPFYACATCQQFGTIAIPTTLRPCGHWVHRRARCERTHAADERRLAAWTANTKGPRP